MVPLVAEQPGCLASKVEPARVVGLVVEAELARLDLHQPVPHALAAALRVPVGRRLELAPERAAEAGLLLDLAQGALLLGLAAARAFPSGTSSRRTPGDGRGAPRARRCRPGRPLRRRPERVSADRLAALPCRAAPTCRARLPGQPPSGRARAARAGRRRMRSRASGADSAHSLIRSCATTASWWSPRMSCSCFATATNFAPGLPSSWAARSAA